ncbi:MAG: glycogen/starch/alpha-glucan phosphorylase [Defluviitaleaceae bacterium]|nr:glycogen/starch/alpha-glucan phosphorylase [Defluviitaleaceae bacterium]
MYGKEVADVTSGAHYEALSELIKAHICSDWIKTKEQNRAADEKQVYYLSIEFLLGKLLGSNVLNLGLYETVHQGLNELGLDFADLEEVECDAGLGNGGLGRLAACFLDSLASLDLPGHGFGIRYQHGLFEQKIVDGYQEEHPDPWLVNGNAWEKACLEDAVRVHFWGDVTSLAHEDRLEFSLTNSEEVCAIPYDVPVIGYQNKVVNTLRLWRAEISTPPDFKPLDTYTRETEAITDTLYPDDSYEDGKILRLKQQYFLVSASLQDIIKVYKRNHDSLHRFHEHVSFHINDTHPVLAIPEMMRLLVDEEKMSWDEAWHVTTHTFSYTNHTLLIEAMEKWQIHLIQALLPRIYQIIHEINERFCKELWDQYPYDWDRIEHMAIIAHGVVKMAHLAVVGSYSVNGVAKVHSDILKQREMNLFYQFYPEKFNSKTNGITFRRWLLQSNPQLTTLLKETIGDGFIKKPTELEKLLPFAEDTAFLEELASVKKERKTILAHVIEKETGIIVDPTSIFDIQVKRLHAYKRQLLNALHIMYLYNRLKEDPHFDIPPRTFIFGAKAAPGYYYAKKVIKLIHAIADIVNHDPQTKDRLKVIFLENYRVSLAENIFPAADISEQISTATKEASGTGNMKFMLNGALTLGTLDGANVEMMEAVGAENMFIFGLTIDEVMAYGRHGGYRPSDYYNYDGHIHQVLEQLVNGFFETVKPSEFDVLYQSLLHEDEYFLLKDFESYAQAHQLAGETFMNQRTWFKKATLNIAKAGFFSSDRTIGEYAKEIWKIRK